MTLFIFGVVQGVCITGLLVCVMQLIRISYLSSTIHGHIDRVFEERMALVRDGRANDSYTIPYPDVERSYANLKWYKFWQRPSTLVVF